MKSKDDFIGSIVTNPANLEHIAESHKINGTMLVEIKRVMQEFSDQQLNDYKRKLKEEIERQLVPFTSITMNDAIRNDYRREVIKLIDTIQQ